MPVNKKPIIGRKFYGRQRRGEEPASYVKDIAQSGSALGPPCWCSDLAASDLMLSAGTQWLRSRQIPYKHRSADWRAVKHSSQQGFEHSVCTWENESEAKKKKNQTKLLEIF